MADDAKQILVVTSNRNMKRHITRALASAGYAVTHVPLDRERVLNQLARHLDMCIVDVDEHGEGIEWLLEHLYRERQEVIALLTSEDHQMPFLRDSLATKSLNNLIAKHGGVAATSELIDESEVIVTCHKLFRHDIFGLEKYLTTWGIQIHELSIDGTESKGTVLGELEGFLDAIDCYGTVKNSVLLVADELVMNAIFNAPRDAAGRPKYATLDRSQPLVLEPAERATFRYACDGRHIALSVADRFGSLDRDVIIRYLQRCFAGGPAEVEEKEGGAGLGLHMVFNSITQLTFNVHAGVSTEVIAMFYVRSGSLAFKTSGRSLNMFYPLTRQSVWTRRRKRKKRSGRSSNSITSLHDGHSSVGAVIVSPMVESELVAISRSASRSHGEQ
jgi:CheY-like chemotaxis protein